MPRIDAWFTYSQLCACSGHAAHIRSVVGALKIENQRRAESSDEKTRSMRSVLGLKSITVRDRLMAKLMGGKQSRVHAQSSLGLGIH